MQFPYIGYLLSVPIVFPIFGYIIYKQLDLQRIELRTLVFDMLLLAGLIYLCIFAMAIFNSEIALTLSLYIPALPVIFYSLYIKIKREHILSEKIKSSASETNASVQEASSAIAEITSTLENSSDNCQNINRKISTITVLITTVQEVAERLKLLSLNANIEASRAGEHGRGFIVVAEEFGKLSTLINSNLFGSFTNATEIINAVKELTADMEAHSTATEQLSATFEMIASSMEDLTALTAKGGA